MAADGSIIIDVSFDKDKLEKEIKALNDYIGKFNESFGKAGSAADYLSDSIRGSKTAAAEMAEGAGKLLGGIGKGGLYGGVENGSSGLNISQEEELQAQYLDLLDIFYQNMLNKYSDYYSELIRARAKAYEKDYSSLNGYNKTLIELLASYKPKWYTAGTDFMQSLANGIASRMGQVKELIDELDSYLSRVNMGSGDGSEDSSGNVPAYGRGGVVSKPHLAIVGDTPEAIIPLNRLNEIITGAAAFALPYVNGADYGGDLAERGIVVNQNVIIQQPVESPAETARAVKRVSKELAYGL